MLYIFLEQESQELGALSFLRRLKKNNDVLKEGSKIKLLTEEKLFQPDTFRSVRKLLEEHDGSAGGHCVVCVGILPMLWFSRVLRHSDSGNNSKVYMKYSDLKRLDINSLSVGKECHPGLHDWKRVELETGHDEASGVITFGWQKDSRIIELVVLGLMKELANTPGMVPTMLLLERIFKRASLLDE